MKRDFKNQPLGGMILLGGAVHRIALVLLVVFFWGGMTMAWSAACKITATPLSFGLYDMLSQIPRDATAQLLISCNNKTTAPATVQVRISAGGGTVGQRRMTGPIVGSVLLYNLFSNPGMTSIVGDGAGGSEVLTNIVDKSTPWNVTLYGRIPPLQSIPIGVYADALTATILY